MKKVGKKLMAFTLATTIIGSSFFTNYADAASKSDEQMVYNGHVYQLFDKGMTWAQAKRYCENLGGHLVTITSKSEMTQVKTLIKKGKKNSYWLGAKRNSSNKWSWVTGEKFKYSNWAQGQPDNYTGTEDALMLYRKANPVSKVPSGKWNDVNLDGTCRSETFFGKKNFGFICEWDAAAPKTPSVTKVTKSNGTINGKTSKNVTVYIKIDTTTYSGKSNKNGKFTIKTLKLKSGTKVRVWAKNSYNLKSKVKTINVY